MRDADVIVDAGLHQLLEDDHHTGRPVPQTRWISRAAAALRAGFAGRQGAGTVVRLYSRAAYEAFRPHERAELQYAPAGVLYLYFIIF